MTSSTTTQTVLENELLSTDAMVPPNADAVKQQPGADGDTLRLDTTNVKLTLPIGRTRGAHFRNESSGLELLSISETPVASSPASEGIDIYSPLSSSSSSLCSSPTPTFIGLKSILKNTFKPQSAQGFNLMDSDTEYEEENDEDSDIDGDDDLNEDEESESDESDEYDESDEADEVDDSDNEYSDETGSFICFAKSVHFNLNLDVHIIPNREGNGDDCGEPELTFHEQALLKQGSKRERERFEQYSVNNQSYDSDEHGRDVVELDKQLFTAYVNGIRNMNAEDYRSVVLSRTLNAGPCEVDVLPFIEDLVNQYLDRVVESLLGFFQYLFPDEEYHNLLFFAEDVTAFDDHNRIVYKPSSSDCQQVITQHLTTKLAGTSAAISENGILEWVAGELIEPLGRQALFYDL
ncbi:hypothetical protein PAAG_06990 [Paracoccidioides lutzii Pb01]|uniref:Uncharacterized protein n=1 Tax=Paracoccidioides lutzii (strain ATCC MYA-826 / Pb01) TaxID=502779 RepID=C1H8J4_PARBA|nr:hypothetical protein PAAG_06990 [Paracoccidioides lutzii Pb01]EEH36572.1 hypothetical protein PAAG_06990 [Paracoccidioides lutzii Pb01]